MIWQVQLITYPQFASIDSVSFPQFHEDYCRRITWIVGPLMLLELGSTASGVLALWNTRWKLWSILGLFLVLTMWGTTALVQVPQHEQLSFGFDPEVSKALVQGNWVRVMGWTLHLAVISGILYSRYGSAIESKKHDKD